MSLRVRILVCLAIGLVSGVMCSLYQETFARGAGDLGMPLCMGEALLADADPYAACRGFQSDGVTPNTANPLTTVIITLPLLWLPPSIAAGVFFGLSSGLLAWALTRTGDWWRLLTLLALPYWQAMVTVQWSPLLLAVWFWPALLALTLAKPHVGAAVALTTPWRPWPVAMGVVIGVVSLLVMPTWPFALAGRIGAMDDYLAPLLIFPGFLLLLAGLQWRTREGRFLLLLSFVPQRAFYDQLLVFAVPRTMQSLLVLVLCSWLTYFGWFFWPGSPLAWLIVGLYLPALGILFVDRYTLAKESR
ncbi:hypothetical protein [Candidatus Chloroploca sp. Khr17]|uniref:hypothetical protein n=1 Tax=Candidatus Chloroploca sp. Khr17 TaxID=2496869 RepID=UPI00101DA1DF|nr:hypothetical protein [Candidatus Chloroploca sp. Khr17]